ncbi:MAG: glutamate synthase large subunit [Lentisphaeria bacterium]|jgi:glutamate synthase domain-containing protein 2/glutamate synthase domain-containing protein 1/glutamate synthase domain-containing protein 3
MTDNPRQRRQPWPFRGPAEQGLYSPEQERDACGVGMVCDLKGRRSHAIVRQGLRILENLAHRGATGADARTGDGAGILIQLPHAFFKERCAAEGLRLPGPEEYAAGLLFLPRDSGQRRRCEAILEDATRAAGQEFLGWRQVPVNRAAVGEIARESEPVMRQAFIGRGKGVADAAAFERKLYVIRKLAENAVRQLALPEGGAFYICSLSCRTFVYKGMLLADQMTPYFPDLADPLLDSGLAMVHQRYSTNTFPAWQLAQPFRYLAHNGEINTLRGNINWMAARQGLLKSPLLGPELERLYPLLTPGASDSAILDNAVELLVQGGRSLPHAIMMLIPEAWQHHRTMADEKRAFYEYHACLMEPWDGPASIPFTDGKVVGAVLDRNGLRPSRYTVTKDGLVVMGSETGVLEIAPANVASKGRLQPGRMFLVDTEQGRIIDDAEVKEEMGRRKPYRQWLKENMIPLESLPEPAPAVEKDPEPLAVRQRLFGYTLEDLRIILAPMGQKGEEPTGSMGTDTPPAVLSERPRLLFDYFHQLFAQVTNPPLDAIREELVTSLSCNFGAMRNLFEETPAHCRRLKLEQPVLTAENMRRIRLLAMPGLRAATVPMLFPPAAGGDGLRQALETLRAAAAKAVAGGATILILSDRQAGRDLAPIPALLATAAVHLHLVRQGLRTSCGLVVETGEAREVHHLAMLVGFGAGAVHPWLAFESLEALAKERRFLDGVDSATAKKHFIKALDKGLLKVMSKMGISTVQSYRGAQIFEAVGLSQELVAEFFEGTASRIGGIGLAEIAEEARRRHEQAFPPVPIPASPDLEAGGLYQWRRDGEAHLYNPLTIAKLRQATWTGDATLYREYSRLLNAEAKALCNLRGLLELQPAAQPLPLAEVEPWTEIVKRFKTGAMSYGSISQEAHETLAIAMNRLGGKSNSGEGGEDEARYRPDPQGNWRISAIKQIATGRFGVTSHYLVNARELQIKMAQGAKPGEGGQLPGEKVYPWIAKTRHSTPYVQLISPPPHHDIYSIEDLAQLIFDLKNANPEARVSVKLVSEVGVGTVAAGVAKGKADVILISGWDGGTGASPETSLKHAGLPWELGLAETHQTLVLNRLRDRVRLECDGKLMTGRDVAIACLLGAEEFGFATAPLVTLGCIMMRVCHLNTCPAGIATQDPELRQRFAGKPEYVVNFFRFIAEELREIMAQLGFRTLDEMVGHSERLDMRAAIAHWKAKGLDFSRILHRPEVPATVGTRCTRPQDHGLDQALDNRLIELARPALEAGQKVELDVRIRNVNRTLGTMLSSQISKHYGADGLPAGTITVRCSGAAGQSFGAFGAKGLTLTVEGDANDYFGKGLSGARLAVFPPREATFTAEENIIIGNVALYGATSGEAYIRGIAGERFAVRNSGAKAVVEGLGDHGCEYMTGGRVVVLGPTGRNFAAGMSGGIAYVLDEDGRFAQERCNLAMVNLETLFDPGEAAEVRGLVQNHLALTGSPVARRVLDRWPELLPKFVKVMPKDYKRALALLQWEK